MTLQPRVLTLLGLPLPAILNGIVPASAFDPTKPDDVKSLALTVSPLEAATMPEGS